MNGVCEVFLVAGIIFLAAFSMYTSNQAMNSMNAMNHQVQMMFVKS